LKFVTREVDFAREAGILIPDEIMTDSYLRLYVHFVWGTWQREPFLLPTWEERVYHCFIFECEKLKCRALAVGGVEDHVHVLVSLHGAVAPATLVKQMKGVSSHLVNHEIQRDLSFRWQSGYGAISVAPSGIDAVRDYIGHQKQRHARGKLWPMLERINEPEAKSGIEIPAFPSEIRFAG